MSHPADPGRVEQKPPAVAFVSMPFHRCTMPPIALGILKSALAESGLPSTVYNFNLDLLPDLGDTAEEALRCYELIGDDLSNELASEWFFAPPDDQRDARYLALLPDRNFEPGFRTLLPRVRSRVDDFILRSARRVVAGGHDIVGFSAAYSRTRANVRLAEAIRRLAPGTRFLIGGYEASGDMGYALLEAFPVFDLVCHTEADELIVPIVRALRGEQGYGLDSLRGISYRQRDRLVSQLDGAPDPEVERAPLPDYHDYFEQLNALRASWDDRLDLPFWIPVETARGCWWGARQHCVFCSYNSDRMTFRPKSPDRVLNDLETLRTRHGKTRFMVVDSILSNDYFRTLLPRLAEMHKGYAFHWEVRPTVRREDAATLARAGVFHAFLGVESLSTPALHLMHKGTSAIDNIQTLKWLMAYDVRCTWHFLFSLPGERLEWYEDVARAIPRLMHLQPPRGLYRIAMERFSPFFATAQETGVNLLGPTIFARLAFADVSDELLGRFVCDFDHEITNRPPDLDSRITEILEPLLARWRESFEARGCTLSLVDGPDESLLIEGPLLEPDRILRVRGLLQRFFKGCASIQSERVLLEQLAADGPPAEETEPPLGPRAYSRLLEEICLSGARPEEGPTVMLLDVVPFADARGWIFRESGRILSLPVDQTRFVESGPFQLQAALRHYQ